jgi:diguanylate cyclase (GGDEF)-like protein
VADNRGMPLDPEVVLGLAFCGLLASLALGTLYWRQTRRGDRLQRSLSAAHSRASDAELRDAATGALSRRGLDDALAALAQRDAAAPLTVLCVGLDAFRLLQDTHGAACVDPLLLALAKRLSAVGESRRAIARVGTDEFVLISRANVTAGLELAQRLRAELAQPFTIDGHEIRLTASVGVAAGAAAEAPQVVARAANAMRAVMQAGGDDHAEFDPRMAADQRDQAELVRDLRHAIERKEFELFYQPKVDSQSLQVTAAEALLRWRHPRRGMVSPAVFIPLAERHGLIGKIGNWVLDEALRQAAVWRKGGLRMRVAINVSGYQMRQDDFAARLERGLRSHGLQAERFTCEITESVAMEDTVVAHRAFARLGRLGVHVSIDDFGTGHSSLASLRRLPASELKIDRAFVADLGESAEARSIVQAILQMAHSLRLRVVAEGVETEAQRDFLMVQGCDEMQGYLFAKPMSARALGLWAMDGPTTLAQTFSSSLFKDTLPLANGQAPTQVMTRA